MDIQLANNQMCEEFFDLLFTNHTITLRNNFGNIWTIYRSSRLINVDGSNMKTFLFHFSFPDNINEYMKINFTYNSDVLFTDIPLSLQKTIKQIIGRMIIECFNWNSNITICSGLPGNKLVTEARSLEEAIIQLELKNGIEV